VGFTSLKPCLSALIPKEEETSVADTRIVKQPVNGISEVYY